MFVSRRGELEKEFMELDVGEVFMYEGTLYMKVDDAETTETDRYYNAIQLSDNLYDSGATIYVDDAEPVVVVLARIIIEYPLTNQQDNDIIFPPDR